MGTISVDEIMERVDCRTFGKFSYSSSLQSATPLQQVYWKERLADSGRHTFDTIVTKTPAAQTRSFPHLNLSRGDIQEIILDEVEEFPVFCKTILIAGSYCIVLVQFGVFEEWFHAFSNEGFTVLPYP